jgi:hypothetical protein
MRLLICAILLFVTFQSFSQVVVTVTYINSDKPLLRVLNQKLAYNGIIFGGQMAIHEALKAIKNSKKRIRLKDYEGPKPKNDLKTPVRLNTIINGILLGVPTLVNTKFSFYNTPSKRKYFIEKSAINFAIGLEIENAMKKKNSNIRNANTQELYSLNFKMLTKLKETNKNVHKTAAFVIVASLLTEAVVMSSQDWDLDTILELGL